MRSTYLRMAHLSVLVAILAFGRREIRTCQAGPDPYEMSRVYERLRRSECSRASVHAALHWAMASASSQDRQLHTECFREGALQGVLLLEKRPAGWVRTQSVVTDGDVILDQGGSKESARVDIGPERMAAWLDLWEPSLKNLPTTYPMLGRRKAVSVMYMGPVIAETGLALSVGLRCELGREGPGGLDPTRLGWLEETFLAQFSEVAADASAGRATFSGPRVDLELALDTGLPTSCIARGPSEETSLRGVSVAPMWSRDAWRKYIREAVAATDKRGLDRPPGVPLSILDVLLRDLLTASQRRSEELQFVVEKAGPLLTVYAYQCGSRGVYSLPDPAQEQERLQEAALAGAAAGFERALGAGWPREAALMLGLMVEETCMELFNDPRFR